MKKIIPKLHIDEEISIFGNTMNLHGIIYHEGEQANSGHYTSRVKVNDRWFLISDSNVMDQDEQSRALIGTTNVPYMLIYKKKSNITSFSSVAINNNLNNRACSILEVKDTSTSEVMNRQSVLKEIENQKQRIINADEKKKSDSIHNIDLKNIKSPIKRKLKYSRVTSGKRVAKHRNNLDDDVKQSDNKAAKERMSKLRDNLDDDEKSKIQDNDQKRKRILRANLDDDAKKKFQNKDTKQHQTK